MTNPERPAPSTLPRVHRGEARGSVGGHRGEQLLRRAIAALRKPEWLRDRLLALECQIEELTTRIHQLTLAAQRAALTDHEADTAALQLQDAEDARGDLIAEREVLNLGWAAYVMKPERRQL